MAKRLLFTMGTITLTLVTLAAAAQIAFPHEPNCTLNNGFECSAERDADNVFLALNTPHPISDVRITGMGACNPKPVFIKHVESTAFFELVCHESVPKVSLKLNVIYDLEEERAVAIGSLDA